MPGDRVQITVECTPRLRPRPEYASLLQRLRDAEFDPVDRPPMEQRDGGFVAIVVALYLGQKLLDAATDRLTAAVLDSATTHLRPLIRGRGAGESLRIPIYGPDGEVIREIVVPEDDEDAV